MSLATGQRLELQVCPQTASLPCGSRRKAHEAPKPSPAIKKEYQTRPSFEPVFLARLKANVDCDGIIILISHTFQPALAISLF
jgi:hypothetical protein